MKKINIKGMTCQNCVQSIKEALEKIPGVKNVIVNLEQGYAQYEGMIPEGVVKKAIQALGFDAE